MNKHYKMMWVDPKFHQVMKMKAAENNISILELTRKFGDDCEELAGVFKSDKGKKKISF